MILLAALLAQYHYYPPEQTPAPGETLTRVEVLVYDDPKLGGLQVVSASFNEEAIPLKPRDIYNYRGSASFALRPGTYELDWTVERDPRIWPRTIDHTKNIEIKSGEFWVQIKIEGNQASID